MAYHSADLRLLSYTLFLLASPKSLFIILLVAAWRRSLRISISTVERMAKELGLQLNLDKSEVICDDSTTKLAMLCAVPGLSVTD